MIAHIKWLLGLRFWLILLAVLFFMYGVAAGGWVEGGLVLLGLYATWVICRYFRGDSRY